jgi:hypothetical protein
MLQSLKISIKKLMLIFTYFLYKLTNLQLFMHIHYLYYKNLVSTFTEDELTTVDKRKITNQNPQNPNIVYSDEMDMYNKFDDYIIKHNKSWSSFITFSKIHYAILIKNSVYMEKNTPVMKVIKRYLQTYDSYNTEFNKSLTNNDKIKEDECPFTGAIDIKKLKIDENKKLHLFMIQTHLMPEYLAECFIYDNFELEKLRKIA